jgi:SAM-dependent methyltransferase
VLVAAERGVTSIESDLESLRLPSESIHCVGLFDVLEHVENRPKLLSEIGRCLKNEGSLIITVPAVTWLWSKADEDVGHFLRYSRRTIKSELAQNGFEVQSSNYMFFSLVFPLLLLRVVPYRLGFRQPVDDGVLLSQGGGLLGKILGRFETAMSRIAPIGSSLLIVATKRNE